MAAPRTWSTSELVTASIGNAHWRDMFTALAAAKPLVIGLGDPGGAVLTTGVKFYMEVPFGLRINSWTLISIETGSLVLDLWKAAYPTKPTVANTITGSEKPTISASDKGQDLTLTTWITDLAQGDILAIKVDSCTSIKQATLTLRGSLLALL